jgi:hypothetical protein
MIKLRFQRYNDYTEKWSECGIDDLYGMDHSFYIDDVEYELGDFIKTLIKRLNESEGKTEVNFLQ